MFINDFSFRMDDKSSGILKDYELSLEDLTFNSKPIINMLTMLADKHKSLAPQIIELIETRFFKVRTDHRLPTLYLLDSIIKNLGGEFLQLISKNIVRLFCEAFQSLTDAKVRISLYKLRQTWTPYIAVKKLAAIDQHIHAMDQNWPITAQEDPLSPTIFVNPKFLGPNESKTNAKMPANETTPTSMTTPIATTQTVKTEMVNATQISSVTTVSTTKGPTRTETNHSTTSIQDKRCKLRESLRQKKLNKQKAMGLLPAEDKSHPNPQPHPSCQENKPHTSSREEKPHSRSESCKEDNPSQENKLHPSSMEFVKTLNPIPRKKRQSPSPMPEPSKKSLIFNPDSGSTEEKRPNADEENPSKRPRVEEEFKPINPLLLDLDDLPSELFQDHQAYILQQAKHRLKSGNLSASEHNALVEQVEQLYNLQKIKNEKRKDNNISTDCQTHTPSHPSLSNNPPHPHSPPHPPPHPHSPPHQPPHPHPPPHPHSPPHPPHHPHSPPHHPSHPHSPPHQPHHPPHPQSPPHHPPHPHSPPHRPPYRSRSPHRPPAFSSVPSSHFDDNFPRRGLGSRYGNRGNYRPHLPPRYRGERSRRPRPWDRGHPPVESGGYYPRPHPERYPVSLDRPHPQGESTSAAPPVVDVSLLYKQLQQSGLLSTNNPPPANEAPPTNVTVSPPIPEIPLTISAIRRRYDNVINLLLRGEPCTSCGLRFTNEEKDDYQRHLDWHYNENRIEKEGTRSISRNWYIHYEDWLTLDESSLREHDPTIGGLGMETVVKEDSIGREDVTIVSCKVLPGEDSEVCSLCHEPLEQFWEEDEEEWHFKEAIRAPDSQLLFHSNCYVDYKETATPVEQEGSQLFADLN